MVAIIINHLVWAPSLYTFLTGESSLFASAAEGFFMISGVLVGYIYGPRILIATKTVFKKIWKRAGILYLLTVFFTFFYTAWASLHPESGRFHTVYDQGVLKYLYNTLTVRYAYGWTDFLSRYTIFMLAAPLLVWLTAKGKGWLVAAGSIAVWFFLRKIDFFLPFSAWQLVFTLGVITGYYLPAIEQGIREWPHRIKSTVFTLLVSVFIVTYIYSITMVVVLPYVAEIAPSISTIPVIEAATSFYAHIDNYFDKSTLDPARILLGTVWFTALYAIFRRYETRINQLSRGVLLLFGQQSLFVYCLHAFLIFAIVLYASPTGQPSLVTNTLVATLVLAVIYIITKHRAVFTQLRYKLLPSTQPKSALYDRS